MDVEDREPELAPARTRFDQSVHILEARELEGRSAYDGICSHPPATVRRERERALLISGKNGLPAVRDVGLTHLVQTAARSNHHGFVRSDAEKAQDDIVQPCPKDGRFRFKVAVRGCGQHEDRPSTSSVPTRKKNSHPHPPALIVRSAVSLQVGEVPRDFDFPFWRDRSFRHEHDDDDARQEEHGP